MTKPTKWHVRPAKNQISLGIRPNLIRVFAVRMKKPWTLSYPLSASEDSDQTGRTWHFVGFVMRRRIYIYSGRARLSAEPLKHRQQFPEVFARPDHNKHVRPPGLTLERQDSSLSEIV